MDDDDIGVATECPEDMTGCFYSKSSTVSLLHITFLLFDLFTFASSFRNDEQTEMPKSSSRLLLLLDARRGMYILIIFPIHFVSVIFYLFFRRNKCIAIVQLRVVTLTNIVPNFVKTNKV